MTERGTPDVTIVIPTHNRRDALLATLRALSTQTISADRFEVIVVIDAGSDDTGAVLDRTIWPFALRHCPSSGRGAAAARNTGAALAGGARILFLDDDIHADTGLLAAHLRSGTNGTVVVGQSAPVISAAGWFGQSLTDWWNGRFRDMASPGYRMGYTDVMSGNLSLDSVLFHEVGGFDATLLCREDYELGLRLVGCGASIRYDPLARGLHHDASTPARSLQRARNEGTADIQIAQKHPALFCWLRCANMAAPTIGSQVLRFLCFDAPFAGRLTQSAASAVLPFLERLGLKGYWQSIGAHARALAYQQGVATAIGSLASLQTLRDRAALAAPTPTTLDIDLTQGIDAARASVEHKQPGAMTVHIGDRKIAALHAEPGLEPIGAAHLDAILNDHVWDWAPVIEVARELSSVSIDVPDWVKTPRKLRPAEVSLAELDISGASILARSTPMDFPVKVLIRSGTRPIGWIYLHDPIDPVAFWPAIRRSILASGDLCRRLIRPLPQVQSVRPPISVIVCTRDRTASLTRCLAALTAVDYPDYEIVVIDNAPTSPDTELLVRAQPNLRYCREDRPGLDWARNRGVAEARHDIIAFTDDDTEVDRHWLDGLAEAFAEPAVDFVTGLVLPMKLDTDARHYFENVYGGMGKGFDAQTRDPQFMWPHDILWASALGVGANMAFRRRVFDRAGPFDPALDVGTATRGGGDIEMFHRALAKGCVHVYQPSAFLWHEHREDFAGLRRQLSDNGSGFASYLLACLRNKTVPRLAVARFAARAWLWDWQVKRLIRPGRHRRDFVWAEIAGLLRAPRLWREATARAKVMADSHAKQGSGQ